MKRTFFLLFGLFFLTNINSNPDATSPIDTPPSPPPPASSFDQFSDTIRSVYQRTKSYVSKKYYIQSVKHTLYNQEDDYRDFINRYEAKPLWKKTFYFIEKIRAKNLNEKIIHQGQECLSILNQEPFDFDYFSQIHEEFLALRNRFIARYDHDSQQSLYLLNND